MKCPECGKNHRRLPIQCESLVNNAYTNTVIIIVASGYSVGDYPVEKWTPHMVETYKKWNEMIEYMKKFEEK